MSLSEADRLLAAERATDAARAQIRSRQFDRQRGVAWSGFEPEPDQPQDEQRLRRRVAARLAARAAWRAGSDGALLEAVCACQAAARDGYASAERVRAGIARGEPPEWRAEAVADLARQADAFNAALGQARRALATGTDRAAP